MVSLTRVKEATKEFIKVLRFGKSDVVTADQYLPHGIDSKPVKDKMAVYVKTGDKGEPIVLGYLANSDKTKEGESRLYSTDSDGVDKIAIYLTNNGIAEIGGNTDFMLRFSETEKAYNQLKSDHDSLVDAFNQHMHPTAATGPPSIPTPIPSLIPAIPSTGDISGAKIDEIKTL